MAGPAAIGALGNIAGGLASTGLSAHFAKQASDKQWKRQGRYFQTMVADLKKAGINPLIAFGGGAHAGAVPPVQVPETAQFGGIGSEAASRFIQGKLASSALELQAEQTNTEHYRGERERFLANNEAMRSTMLEFEKGMQPQRFMMDVMNALAQRELMRASARQGDAGAQLLELQKPGALNRSLFDKEVGVWGPTLEEARKWLDALPF